MRQASYIELALVAGKQAGSMAVELSMYEQPTYVHVCT